MWIRMHHFARRSKRVCPIVTRRPLGQSPKWENSALLECHLALQKCRIGSWTLNALLCLGAVWTSLLEFFDLSLHLDAFSSFVYEFFFLISFLDNLGFFFFFFIKKSYLVDKYPKRNLDKVQIIYNFIVIQSSLLFLCMHPYFKY